jgi:hypothetical protein
VIQQYDENISVPVFLSMDLWKRGFHAVIQESRFFITEAKDSTLSIRKPADLHSGEQGISIDF